MQIHPFFLPSLAHHHRCSALPSHSSQQTLIPFISLLLLYSIRRIQKRLITLVNYQTIPLHTEIIPPSRTLHSLYPVRTNTTPFSAHSLIIIGQVQPEDPCCLTLKYSHVPSYLAAKSIPSSRSKCDLKLRRKSPHLKRLIPLFILSLTRLLTMSICLQFPAKLILSLTLSLGDHPVLSLMCLILSHP
jgi:hypothetical protein